MMIVIRAEFVICTKFFIDCNNCMFRKSKSSIPDERINRSLDEALSRKTIFGDWYIFFNLFLIF